MNDGRPDVSAFDADEQARRAYRQGRLDGFSEARDAVAALQSMTGLLGKADALAAIDGLRGSVNPDTPPSAEKGEQA